MIPKEAPTIESLADFARVLRLGLGRAILFLRQHDATPYRDVILHACTHWTGYDQQVEGTRTAYLLDILDATAQMESYVEPILKAFRKTTDDRDLQQLIRLAGSLAEDGYAAARDALYERFGRNDTGAPIHCAFELIALDGVDGLLHVAERMGMMLLDNPGALGDDDWVLTATRRDAEEQCGKETVQQALDRAAHQSPRIRAYMRAGDAVEAEWAAHRAEPSPWEGATYEQVKQQIVSASPPSPYPLRLWGQTATDEDLTHAATDLLGEQDERRLCAYLKVFERRTFPGEIDRLLTFVRHPSDQVMLAATNALSHVAHPRVRTLALEILADPTLRGWRKSRGVDMLRSNYEAGDEQLLAQLLSAEREEVEYHSIGLAALEILEAHPSPQAARVLHPLYEHGPCTNCRMRAVRLLRKLGALPQWLLTECRYDADTDLREAADAWLRDKDEEPADD